MSPGHWIALAIAVVALLFWLASMVGRFIGHGGDDEE